MFNKQFILLSTVADGKKHKHHQKWVDYRKKVKALVSGEGYRDLLHNFAPREDAVLFDQRVKLNKELTVGISSRILASFKRALRNDEVTKSIEPQEAMDLVNNYYDGKTVEEYTKEYIFPYSVYDPNAFLIVDFKAFNNQSENADPYPFIVSSENVIDYRKTVKGKTQYIIIENGSKFVMYNSGEGDEDSKTEILVKLPEKPKNVTVISFKDLKEEIAKNPFEEREPFEAGTYFDLGGEYFMLDTAEPNIGGKLQCYQLGYLLDMKTDQESYVSPLDPCLPRLEAIATTGSEMFLTKALHAFPQKIQRGVKCSGEFIEGHQYNCDSGFVYAPNGEDDGFTKRVCNNCSGSGVKMLPTTAAETLIIPVGEDKDDTLSLNEVAAYLPLDIKIMEFQDYYIKEQTEECLRDMYARSAFTLNLKAQTATEVNVSEDSVDDVLYPFTQFFSQVYKWQVEICGLITDTEIESIVYDFPATLKMRSRLEAIAELKQSEGAPYAVIQATQQEIITKQFKNQPEEKQKHLVRMMHSPFQGKTPEEIAFIISSGTATAEKAFFYGNEEDVWCEVEDRNENFYLLPYKQRKDIIKEAIEDLMPERTLPEVDG